jgi:hypothetical protein
MSITLTILAAACTVGAVDVLYYHLHRFRLFAQEGSVAEEITHLLRHVTFLAVIPLLASGSTSPAVDRAILALLAIDLVNSAADVLLERRSRAPLGGLPSGEYLVHFLGTFGTGLAAASYLFERRALPLRAPEGIFAWQVRGMMALGLALLVIEGSLFARALVRRSRARAASASGRIEANPSGA